MEPISGSNGSNGGNGSNDSNGGNGSNGSNGSNGGNGSTNNSQTGRRREQGGESRRVIAGIASFIILAFILLPLQYFGIPSELLGDQVTVNHYNVTGHHHEILETVPVTIVCQLSGEMGNNLGKLGHCLSLKWWLESGAFYNATHKLGYNARVALRHQEHGKWVRGAGDLKRCFPNTNQFDFSEANNKEFADIWKLQTQLLGGDPEVGYLPPFNEINFRNKTEIAAGLQSFVSKVSEQHTLVYNNASKRNVSLPFLFSDHMQLIDPLNDQFYNQMRHFLQFNFDCCKMEADPDESVFHFRNFKQEMPRRWDSYGFHEASPQQAANGLFSHLKGGEKIAIVTRYSRETAQGYVDEFTARGLQVRVIDGQDGPADFCFLMSAQKEIVGMAMSTYLLWAGYLGRATRVIAYALASSNHPNSKLAEKAAYNFTSDLKGKFEFRTIQ